MTQFRTILATIAFLFLLGACGQSGPLYLPGNPSEVRAPTQQPPAPAETEEDEESDDGEE